MKMKKIKKSTIVEAQKRKKKIVEFYYMTPEKTDAKELTRFITSMGEEKVDVWPELNLMEVVLDSDSLIFQDGRECLWTRWIWNLSKNERFSRFMWSAMKRETTRKPAGSSRRFWMQKAVFCAAIRKISSRCLRQIRFCKAG